MISALKNNKGYNLIEIMITIAIMGIVLVWLIKGQMNAAALSESEIALQRANQALRNQVELLRSMPVEALLTKESHPFDKNAGELCRLIAGRGFVGVEKKEEFLLLRAEVHWRDPRIGMRSIHTTLLKAL